MTKITINESLEGFLGYDPESIKLIDIESSQSAYEKRVRDEINKMYPELEIEFDWNENDYHANPFSDLDWTPREVEDLQWYLESVEEMVYNSQEFWVEK